MIGTVLAKLQSYMVEKIGPEGWKNLLTQVGLPPDKTYHTIHYYPDTELHKLLIASAIQLKTTKEGLARDLGKDFGNHLFNSYAIMFLPGRKTIDTIEKLSSRVYKILQLIDPKAPKSEVTTRRLSEDKVVVYYNSPRRLCSFIQGVFEATAEHYGEKIEIVHVSCMNRGDSKCEMLISVAKSTSDVMN